MATENGKTKWTAGPWQVSGPLASNPEIRINYKPMHTVATVVNPEEHMTDLTQDDAMANAQLIAAAPELYEALSKVAEYMVPSGGSVFVSRQDVAEIRNALAKARGER